MAYTGKEIINLAVNIEKSRYELYYTAAKKIKGKNDLKGLFLDLAEKEAEHREIFEEMGRQYVSDNTGIREASTENRIVFAGAGHLFVNDFEGSTIAGKVKTPKDALEIALKLKNDNIRFFLHILKETQGTTRTLISRIIAQEKSQAEMIRRFL